MQMGLIRHVTKVGQEIPCTKMIYMQNNICRITPVYVGPLDLAHTRSSVHYLHPFSATSSCLRIRKYISLKQSWLYFFPLQETSSFYLKNWKWIYFSQKQKQKMPSYCLKRILGQMPQTSVLPSRMSALVRFRLP